MKADMVKRLMERGYRVKVLLFHLTKRLLIISVLLFSYFFSEVNSHLLVCFSIRNPLKMSYLASHFSFRIWNCRSFHSWCPIVVYFVCSLYSVLPGVVRIRT